MPQHELTETGGLDLGAQTQPIDYVGGLGLRGSTEKAPPQRTFAEHIFDPLGLHERKATIEEMKARASLLRALKQSKDLDFDETLSLLTKGLDPKITQQMMEFRKQQGSPTATALLPVLNAKRLGQAKSLLPYFDPEFAARFRANPTDMDQSELEANIKQAEELATADKEMRLKTQRLNRVLAKVPVDQAGIPDLSQLNEADSEFLITHFQEKTKRAEQLTLLQEQVRAAKRENVEKGLTAGARVTGELAGGALKSIEASKAAQTLPAEVAEAHQKAAPRSRELIVDAEGTTETQEWRPGQGWVKIASGKRAPGVQVNISPGERKERTEAVAMLKGLHSILADFRGRYVGPIDSRLGAIQSTLNLISQPEADFRSSVQLLRTELRKFYFGTAQSKQELAGALEALPSLDLSDKQFPAAVNASVKKLQRYLQAQDEVLKTQKTRPSMPERLRFLMDVLGADERTAFEVLIEEGY